MTWRSCGMHPTTGRMDNPTRQSPAGVELRAAKPTDAAAIARIHVETWRATYAGLLPDSYLVGMSTVRRAAHWSQALSQPTSGEVVLVADLAVAGVVGFASYGPVRRGGLPRALRRHGEVYTLYVGPDHQDNGVGRLLLTGALKRLSDARFPGAVVWVLAANPSRFFYEAMGARRAAERMERFAGDDLAEIAYEWSWPASGLRLAG